MIRISPAMLEAGREKFPSEDADQDKNFFVANIYRAMEGARRLESRHK
jgi:hypothetical protein